MDTVSRIARRVFYLSLIGWAGTYFMMSRLPPATLIDEALFHEPVQITTDPRHFNMRFRNNPVSVVAVANYELTGLVVSHNDPAAWYTFDITHDSRSPDTRDLCVIWGSNLQSDEYRKFRYHSNDYTCNWRWDAGTDAGRFDMHKISNNHLISDSDAIRDAISRVNAGDQIRIRGKLVNYSESRWNGSWRSSSLTRNDTGMGACEIIFVESISVLHSYNGTWAALHRLFWNAAAAALSLRFVLLLLPVRRRK